MPSLIPIPPAPAMVDVVVHYGADPTWMISTSAVESTDQIQQAITENPGRVIRIPPGNYYITKPLEVTQSCYIQGEPVGFEFSLKSCLYFKDGIGGFVFSDDPSGGAQGSKISDLMLEMLYRALPPPDPSAPNQPDGIHAEVGIRIENCRITQFARHGIYIYGQTPLTESSLFEVITVQVDDNIDGLHIEGGDANAGLIVKLSATANLGWGIVDNSALGNTYIACHARTNVDGPYCIGAGTSGVNASVLVGCYAEGDQPPSQFGDMVCWFGGTNAAGTIGGQLFLPGNARMRFQAAYKAITAPLSAMGGTDMTCPIFSVLADSKGFLGGWGPKGVLSLGQAPGAEFPGDANIRLPKLPKLDIWAYLDETCIQFNGISRPTPISGISYVGGIGELDILASGNNYGDGYLVYRTYCVENNALATMDLFTLGKEGIEIGKNGLKFTPTTDKDRSNLFNLSPGRILGDETGMPILWNGKQWKNL